jgi:Concanavalin A-like lectin/glucanases superfamily
VRQQTVTAPDPWHATGHFVIGRGKYAGAPTDWFAGAVDDVRAYPFPLDAQAAQALATSGLWHFDEGAGTLANDSSPDAATGTLHHAGWTTGPSGSAVSFGGSGWVDTGDHPALDIGDGSASLVAWFRTRGDGSVISKTGAYRVAVNGGRVVATVGRVVATVGLMAVRTTDRTCADGDWHHAAVVLDRTSQRLQLVVDRLDLRELAVDEQLTIDATDLRAHTRSTEFGLMLEDISHSVDGGLYAELVCNRTFKEPWQGGGGSGPVPY